MHFCVIFWYSLTTNEHCQGLEILLSQLLCKGHPGGGLSGKDHWITGSLESTSFFFFGLWKSQEIETGHNNNLIA